MGIWHGPGNERDIWWTGNLNQIRFFMTEWAFFQDFSPPTVKNRASRNISRGQMFQPCNRQMMPKASLTCNYNRENIN